MTYKPPGTSVNVLQNTRLVNLGEGVRIPAIVGIGPATRAVVDEPVQRAAGTLVDQLSAYPATGVVVSQVSSVPGVTAGGLSAVPRTENGVLYNVVDSGSVAVDGELTWNSPVNDDIPSVGSIYYVSYSYDVPDSQYDPITLSDKQLIQNRFGEENDTTGILAVAGNLALENGAPGVTLVQAEGTAYNEANYKTAIDKLQKKSNIEQLVVVFPKGTTMADQNTIITYAISHLNIMNANNKERGLLTGSPSADFASDGMDTIGDASTPNTYLYRSNALKNSEIGYVVPSTIQRADANGDLMTLDGNVAAAAIAGLQTGQTKKSTPIHGKVLSGIVIPDEKWNDFEMNQLGAGNCIVLESKAGVITVRDAITTDGTSADTQELSIRSGIRLVKRTLRTVLHDTYTSQGKVITSSTVANVVGTITSTLQGLVNIGEIAEYGTQDNPITGELKITASQNSVDPRQIDAQCAVKFLYPLKWIVVDVSTYV